MYNLILTVCVDLTMALAAFLLLSIIIKMREDWISECILSGFNRYPVSIFHKDEVSEIPMQIFQPLYINSENVCFSR